MQTINTAFSGISTFYVYNEGHECGIYIGILANGVLPDAETIGDDIRSVDFGKSAEEYLQDILAAMDFPNKGILLVAMIDHLNLACALVSGEVLQDADVKFEMYKLMGI